MSTHWTEQGLRLLLDHGRAGLLDALLVQVRLWADVYERVRAISPLEHDGVLARAALKLEDERLYQRWCDLRHLEGAELRPADGPDLADVADLSDPLASVKAEDAEPFRAIWDRLARQGWLDTRGGAQYRRLAAAWLAAGRPRPINSWLHAATLQCGPRRPEGHAAGG